MTAKHGTMTHKIADNRTRLPFDAFMLKYSDAYVVACFTTHGICLVFDIDEWNGAKHDDNHALYSFKIQAPQTPEF